MVKGLSGPQTTNTMIPVPTACRKKLLCSTDKFNSQHTCVGSMCNVSLKKKVTASDDSFRMP
jgi:hypothetical protein